MEHTQAEHEVYGSPYEQMQRIVARHLCGWISGHGAPLDHFLVDADMMLAEAHTHGVRFHLAGATANPLDGFVSVTLGGK